MEIRDMTTSSRYIRWFSELGVSGVACVGGKRKQRALAC